MSAVSTQEAETHAAIDAIVAEEARWQAFGFRETGRGSVIEIGHIASHYYFREFVGTSEVEDIPQLKGVKPEPISQEEALELRTQHDAKWRLRTDTRDHLHGLWVANFFDDRYATPLFGYIELPTKKHPNKAFSLTVETEGSVSLRVDDPAYTDGGRGARWHEFQLPRGQSQGVHDVKRSNGERHIRTIFKTDTIVHETHTMLAALVTIAQRAERTA